MSKSDAAGAFCMVLHSHLPYCRKAGVWPFGEEWLYEGLLETYLPLLEVFYKMRDARVQFRATVGLTPILLEQLSDPYMNSRFAAYVCDKVTRARRDREKFRKQGRAEYERLAAFYERLYSGILEQYEERHKRDVVGAFGQLQEEGFLEILTSSATHGYLPLMSRDSTIYAQLKTGVACYRRHFGRMPRGIWLPECAYRPGYYVEISRNESYYKKALDEFLADNGIEFFICDSHALEGGEAFGGGKRSGIYGEIIPPSIEWSRPTKRTTFRPYLLRSGCSVFGRHRESGLQVWSADWGYPGDGNYREFHKKEADSGLQYWKITSRQTDLGLKQLYSPEATVVRVNENADHFNRLVEKGLAAFKNAEGKFGVVVAPYDTELFGHWWFEGISWLNAVLEKVSANPFVESMTLRQYMGEHPPEAVADLPESSWGQGGKHYVWLNPQTEWIWPHIHSAERRMEDAVRKHPSESGLKGRILNQAARELLLLESSDWPFLITTQQAKEYAAERFMLHHNRFERLLDGVDRQDGDFMQFLTRCEDLDNPFQDINYRLFAAREPVARKA